MRSSTSVPLANARGSEGCLPIPLANARSSEDWVLSRDRKEAVVKPSLPTRQAALAAGVATAGAAALAYAVRAPRSDFFGPSVWRGPQDRPSVALTFDDGPSESTPEILELLDRHRARAT